MATATSSGVGAVAGLALALSIAGVAMSIPALIKSYEDEDSTIGTVSVTPGQEGLPVGDGFIDISSTGTFFGANIVAPSGDAKTVAVGRNLVIEGEEAVVVGDDAQALGEFAVVVGTGSKVLRNNGLAMGHGACCEGLEGIAIGKDAFVADFSKAIAIGANARTTNFTNIAFGDSCENSGQSSIAVGQGAFNSGLGGTAVGRNAACLANNSVAFGSGASVSGENSMAFGTGTVVAEDNQVRFPSNLTGGFDCGAASLVRAKGIAVPVLGVFSSQTVDVARSGVFHFMQHAVATTPVTLTVPRIQGISTPLANECPDGFHLLVQVVSSGTGAMTVEFDPANDVRALLMDMRDFSSPLTFTNSLTSVQLSPSTGGGNPVTPGAMLDLYAESSTGRWHGRIINSASA